jgi:hypothetical protein
VVLERATIGAAGAWDAGPPGSPPASTERCSGCALDPEVGAATTPALPAAAGVFVWGPVVGAVAGVGAAVCALG